MIELKQISKSKCYEGDQFVFSHHSEVCNCYMTFGIYIPVHEKNEKLHLKYGQNSIGGSTVPPLTLRRRK